MLKEGGGVSDWQLFNVHDDPAELHDLSKKHPEKRQAMLRLWEQYERDNSVILSGDGPFKKREQ